MTMVPGPLLTKSLSDAANKRTVQVGRPAAAAKLRIDKGGWDRMSINPRCVRIEVPQDLDIPCRPQPVNSDAENHRLLDSPAAPTSLMAMRYRGFDFTEGTEATTSL